MAETNANDSDTDLTDQVHTQLDSLQDAVSTGKPPYCAGICEISDFTLFYGPVDNEDAKRLDLSKATEAQLNHLTCTCQAATFGVDQKDVLDETYRKAGKLDRSQFSAKFDIVESGVLEMVKNELLVGENDNRPIRAELYKLNVYDKGSFFKTHKDTPRGESMFGSVVIVFPTEHEGGALVLSHGDRSWTFDSAAELKKTSASGERAVVGYVAFYSDIDHEVKEVTSGHRVTLTFNLYFTAPIESKTAEVQLSSKVAPLMTDYEMALRDKLQALSSDTTLKLKLGFGLAHQYPVQVNGDLQSLLHYLKGSDALIGRVCNQLGLKCYLRLIYNVNGPYIDSKSRYWKLSQTVMVDRVVDFSHWQQIEEGEVHEELLGVMGGTIINATTRWSEWDDVDKYKYESVVWITPLTTMTTVRTSHIAYGNEASLGSMYGKVCLIVEIGDHTVVKES